MANPTAGEIKYQIQQIDPIKFEELVATIWRLLGYQTNVEKASGDRGIDITAIPPGESDKVLIQVKRYSGKNKVGSDEVRKYATLYRQESNVGNVVIVTSNTFTDQAIQLAQDLDIQAIEGDEVAKIIHENYDVFKEYFVKSAKKKSKSHTFNSRKSKKQQNKRIEYLDKEKVKQKIKNESKEYKGYYIRLIAGQVAEGSYSRSSEECSIKFNYASKLLGGYGVKITPSGEIDDFSRINNVDGVTKAGIATYDHKPYAKVKKDSLSNVESEFKVTKLFLNAMGSDINKVIKVRLYEC